MIQHNWGQGIISYRYIHKQTHRKLPIATFQFNNCMYSAKGIYLEKFRAVQVVVIGGNLIQSAPVGYFVGWIRRLRSKIHVTLPLNAVK